MIVNLTKKYGTGSQALKFAVTGGIPLTENNQKKILAIYSWMAFSNIETIDERVDKIAEIAKFELSRRISAEDELRSQVGLEIEKAALIEGPEFFIRPLMKKLRAKGIVPVHGSYEPKRIVQKVTKKEVTVMRFEFTVL